MARPSSCLDLLGTCFHLLPTCSCTCSAPV